MSAGCKKSKLRYNERKRKGSGCETDIYGGKGMAKILCYIYDGMADFEITLLLHRLRNTGKMEIVTISEEKKEITAQSGMHYISDKKISDIGEVSEYEALIIPGGPVNNEQNEIIPIIKEMINENKLVAAICFAPQFLGRAGVLKEYSYTTSCSSDKIKQLGCSDPFYRPNEKDVRCIKDRNVITAKGYAFVDFAIEVCNALDIFETEQQRYEQLERIKED